jgi:hypothetical protein
MLRHLTFLLNKTDKVSLRESKSVRTRTSISRKPFIVTENSREKLFIPGDPMICEHRNLWSVVSQLYITVREMTDATLKRIVYNLKLSR